MLHCANFIISSTLHHDLAANSRHIVIGKRVSRIAELVFLAFFSANAGVLEVMSNILTKRAKSERAGAFVRNMAMHASVSAALCVSMVAPMATQAATLGPQAAVCDGNKSGVLVTVSGLKKRAGTISVRLYANNKATFMERDKWVARVDVSVSKSGSMAICVPAKPGSYAVFVRHDMNGNRKSDRADGGGFSGNPKYSLTDALLKKKPSLTRTAFSIGATTARVSVTLNYVDGLSLGPVS